MSDDPRPGNERSVYPGGLMRCCRETIRTHVSPTRVGEVVSCTHCSASIVVAPDGVWIWDRALGAAFPGVSQDRKS